MYITQEIANRIKNTLKSKNKYMKDMLSDLNLGINSISEFAKGKQLSCISLARIADYLDCSVDYLLGRTDIPKVNKKDSEKASTTEEWQHSVVILFLQYSEQR